MLVLESRNSNDLRTISDLFYYMCDEIEDIRFSTSLMLIIELLRSILNGNPIISGKVAHQIIDAFILALPELWTRKLKLSA